MWETTNIRTKNPSFNRFAPIVCGVPRCDKDSTPHTNRFSTKSLDCEHRKPCKISRDLRINMFYRTRCINTPAVATNWQADPPSLLSKCFCASPWLCLVCFRLLSARFLIGYCFVSRDNLQIIHAFVLGVPPTHQDFWFAIGVPPTFFRADSVTLNTPHTTGRSDKIIFRTTKIIGTLPRIVGRGEIGPKSARLSCGVYPA